MRIALLTLLLLTSCVPAMGTHTGRNLIPNAGFEPGVQPFISGYRNAPVNNDAGMYAIGNNPNQYNSNWPSNIQPHSGNAMMIVNGAQQPDVIVWQAGPIKTKPHSTYYFAAYVTSIFASSPPVLIFRINGVQVGNPILPSSTVGEWSQFYVAWNAGTSRKATISIVDQNTTYYGNDFALDDLSLSTTRPKPVAISACPQL